jgi:hypothetical protein
VFTRASHTGVQHAENQRARNTDVTNIDRAQFLSFGASAIRPSFPVSKSSAPSDASCLTLDNPSCLMFDSTRRRLIRLVLNRNYHVHILNEATLNWVGCHDLQAAKSICVILCPKKNNGAKSRLWIFLQFNKIIVT